MKKDIPHRANDFDPTIENDSSWDLLTKSTTHTPSPAFTQNVLRATRLSEKGKERNFSTFFRPVPALSFLVILSFTLWGIFNDSPNINSDELQLSAISETSTEATTDQGEDWFNQSLLEAAISNPELFSESELVAVLF